TPQGPPSGLLTIAFLDLFELRIEHLFLLGLRAGRAAALGGRATRRLLVHFLQNGSRGLLERLRLALNLLAIIAAHGSPDRLDRLFGRLPIVLGRLVADILDRLLDR